MNQKLIVSQRVSMLYLQNSENLPQTSEDHKLDQMVESHNKSWGSLSTRLGVLAVFVAGISALNFS